MNNPGPKLPIDYPPTMFIPLFTFDSGLTWKALHPESSLQEAKRRLRSQIPDKWNLEHGFSDNFRCGFLMFDTGLLNMSGNTMFVEVSPKDFSVGL